MEEVVTAFKVCCPICVPTLPIEGKDGMSKMDRSVKEAHLVLDQVMKMPFGDVEGLVGFKCSNSECGASELLEEDDIIMVLQDLLGVEGWSDILRRIIGLINTEAGIIA